MPLRCESVEIAVAPRGVLDECRVGEHPQVFVDGRSTDRQGFGERADRCRAVLGVLDDAPAHRVAEGVEGEF